MKAFGQRRHIIRIGRFTSLNVRMAASDVTMLIIRLRVA